MKKPSKKNVLPLRVCSGLVLLASVLCPSHTIAQTARSQGCIGEGEKLYVSGEDGIKLPKLQIERKRPDEPVKLMSPVLLNLTINSTGRICEVHVLRAPDQESGRQIAAYVSDNFRFFPAMRRGQPVSLRFNMIFHGKEEVHSK